MITDVQIEKVYPGSSRVIMICTLIICDMYAVHPVELHQVGKGYKVEMPRTKGRDQEFHDYFHPIYEGGRQDIRNIVVGEYHKFQTYKTMVRKGITPPEKAEKRYGKLRQYFE